jgi:hypothetical protein
MPREKVVVFHLEDPYTDVDDWSKDRHGFPSHGIVQTENQLLRGE